MDSNNPELRTLREIEMEVLAEGRERCASGCNRNSKPKPTATVEFFPLSGRKAWHRRSHLRQTKHGSQSTGLTQNSPVSFFHESTGVQRFVGRFPPDMMEIILIDFCNCLSPLLGRKSSIDDKVVGGASFSHVPTQGLIPT